jgi:hypothetical protein
MAADNASSAEDIASQVKSTVADLGHKAAETIDAQRGAAASGIDSASANLHGRAEDIAAGGQRAASFAHGAADKLNLTADYIRGHDVHAMFEDVKTLVKKNPLPAMVGAAALGFILAKAFSNRD